MKLDDISFGGLTLEEIADRGYPHIVILQTTEWIEWDWRADHLKDWCVDQALIHDATIYTDFFNIQGDHYHMASVWAFSDPDIAVLFKLTWS